MSTAFIFPGQGSQKVGMCKDLYDEFAFVREMFEEVDNAVGKKLSKIIFEGPEGELTKTENTQPALMLSSLAVFRCIEKTTGKQIPDICSFTAGHSLGEFSALTAASALSLGDAAKILQIRGQAMQEAVPEGKGAMFALLGSDTNVAKEICKSVKKTGVCEIANDNSIGQIVLSGETEAVDQAIINAKDKGLKAIKLKVSAPFHCSLMKPAQSKLEEALKEIQINKPSVRVIANVTADTVTLPDTISDNLVQQVTGTVRWTESVKKMIELGVDHFVEVGPGSVLCGLIKRINKDVRTTSIQNLTDINNFVTSFEN